MATARHLVVVAGRDPSTVDELATTLRETFAVRTAYSPGELLGSLDDEVDVVLVSPSLTDTVSERRLRNRGLGCELAVLTRSGQSAASLDGVDDPATVPRTGPPDALRRRVRELGERASYRRLLNQFYDLATRRAELLEADDPGEELDRVEDRLERLRGDLATALDELDDVTAFDVALRSDRERR